MDNSINKMLEDVDRYLAEENYNGIILTSRELLLKSAEELGTDTFIKVSVIFGFALVMAGHTDEAKGVLNSLIKSGMGLIDSSYLLFSMAYQEQDLEKVIEYGRKFIDSIPDPENPPACITVAIQNAHVVVNNMAKVLIEKDQQADAVEILKKGISFKEDYSVLYINLAIAYHSLGEAEDAEVTLVEGIKKCHDKSDLFHTLGVIYEENQYYIDAEVNYVNALNSGYKEAYRDLAILYRKLYKIRDAAEAAENHLNFFPNDQSVLNLLNEIKNLKHYGKPEPKISAALIVKNEEDMLAECIESFREAVDEIVIVDTGSTDNTVEIAKDYNINLFHHEWQNDFSEARNFSISKTTGDWILIIDADERLAREDIVKVRAMKWELENEVYYFSVYSTLPGHLGTAGFGKCYSARLFKKRPEHYYFGIVHNVLNTVDKRAVTDIKIYHLGYDLNIEKMYKKFDRSITLLLKQNEEDPDNSFVTFNTAQMYLSRNFVKEAEVYTRKSIKILEDDPGTQEHILLMSYYQLAIIDLKKKDYKDCENVCLKALAHKEDYIDPMLCLGYCYHNLKEYDKAVDYLERFLSVRQNYIDNEDYNMLIVNKLGSDYEAYYLLGQIERERGDNTKAKEHYLSSLKSNNMYWNSYNSLGKVFLDEEDFGKAAEAFENAIKYGYLNLEQYGTFGSERDEYKKAIENYQLALEKDMDGHKPEPQVKDALAKVDEILKGTDGKKTK
ncbi:glycosyltransferase [candidate division KSB1 bacterium]